MRLPRPERDVPAVRSLDVLAPKLRDALLAVQSDLPGAMVVETLRTAQRQSFLYGFGRDYDDGRGVVTKAATAWGGWHFYGLAVDVIHRTLAWDAPESFWTALRVAARQQGLTSGDDWDRDGIPVEPDPDECVSDRPHVQWWCPGMRVSPSVHARALYERGGLALVWHTLGADA